MLCAILFLSLTKVLNMILPIFNNVKIIKMKITLNIIGLFLTPIGMILSKFNKSLGAAILGAAITLIIVHIFQHYELKKKVKK